MRLATPRLLTAIALGAALAGFAVPGPARATIKSSDIIELNQAVRDSATAKSALVRIRHFLAEKPDSVYNVFLRQLLLSALVSSNAPGAQVASAADTVLMLPLRDAFQRVIVNAQIASYLINRGNLPGRALAMARVAYRDVPPDSRYDQVRGFTLTTLGEALLFNGRADTASVVLERALEFAPDSQRVLAKLGSACEKLNKDDLAIGYYTRSAGVFLSRDSTMLAPLRALWVKRHGSLAGLDAALKSAREASRSAVALEPRRVDKAAPDWSLPDLDGKSATLAEFKGKVLVLDFWGTWCGPCRQELPIFQQIVKRYSDRKDVAFLGVNWERGSRGAEAIARVRDYMAKNNLDFRCLLDHDQIAQNAYQVEGFPTVFLIDRKGRVRFQNVGVAEGIDNILTAQIESLLE